MLVLSLPLNTDFASIEPLTLVNENESVVLAYGSHAPIVITSDADFSSQATGESWTGSGTPMDPYIIEEYAIDATGTCIEISDVTVPFIIRNCDLESTQDGISLTNVNNCTAYNITFTNHNSQGLYAQNSFVTVFNCTFQDNFIGVSLEDSTGCNVTDNSFLNCGMEILGASDVYWNHEIQLNNVNGKSLGYYWNEQDSVYDASSFGQVILAKCDNVTIKHGNFSYLADAILLGHSSDCIIFNNTIHNTTRYGIHAQYSQCTYTNNTLYWNSWGLYLENGIQSVVANNTAYENAIGFRGSFAQSSNYSTNYLHDNTIGIYVFASGYNRFSDNVLENDGIQFTGGNVWEWQHYLSGNTVNGLPIGYFWGLRDDHIDISGYGQIMAANCTGTTFEGGAISNTDIGILMGHSRGNQLLNTQVDSCGTGVSIVGAVTGASISESGADHHLQNITVVDCGSHAIVGFGVNNLTINECTGNSSYTGLEILHSPLVNTGCRISNSTFSENTLYGVALNTVNEASVSDCRIYLNGNHGIHLSGTDHSEFVSNYLVGNSIHLYGSGNNTISNNVAYSILLAQSENHNCTISHNQISALEVQSENCTIYNNTISGSNVYGILIMNADNSVVKENTIYSHQWWGLYVGDTNNAILTRNVIHSNQQHGVLIARTNHSVMTMNNITGNAFDGIQLSDSHHNTIVENFVIENSQLGFLLDGGASENTLYGNVIGWNVEGGAVDDGTDNNWDNGIDRGNQWSDYGGTGVYSIPGSAGSVDNYPSVIAPYLGQPEDIAYNFGSIGNTITWDASAFNPDSYIVYRNGAILDSGSWDGNDITISIDGFGVGVHNITLFVNDTSGSFDSSTVFVTVLSTTTTTSPPPGGPLDSMLIVAAVGGAALLLLLAFVMASRRRRVPKPPPVAPVVPPPEEPEEVVGEVQVLRGCAPVGGKFEYKVKIKNETPYVIHSVTVTVVDYPRDCMELDGESTRRLEKIEPGGFRSPQFSFIPTKDCVEGQILSSVSYVDYQNTLESIEVEPMVIRSVCDLLEPMESSLEEFETLLHDMAANSEEITLDRSPKDAFSDVMAFLPERNFEVISSESDSAEEEFNGTVMGLAQGKYTGNKIAVRIVVTGQVAAEDSEVLIEALGDDPDMLPTTIEEIAEGLRAAHA
jgi:parallel beta-helix repeat protein